VRRPSTEPIVEDDERSVIVDFDQLAIPELLPVPARLPRLRTAVGTTPPTLREPDVADGVPFEIDDYDDLRVELD
jgi:hypothetical protein